MKAKKSLGQHFLTDKKALERIVAAADLKADDNVLEIGPGAGALSKFLVERNRNVIMIEKDGDLVKEIAHNFKFEILNFQSILNDSKYNFKNRSGIISGDILEINLSKLIEQNNFQDYKVVANIPYYITGKIIRLLLDTKRQPKLIVLLVQKEVAERICAKAGGMSILAVSVQYFGLPEIVDIVPKESFAPVPKVDSAILEIVPFNNQARLQEDVKEFFKIVKIGFASPRKTLLNNLSAGLLMPKDEVAKIMKKCSLDIKLRAEDLSVGNWEKLSKKI